MSAPIANQSALSLEARRWVLEARAQAQPQLLYLLSLAHWGLEKQVVLHRVKGTGQHQVDLEEQVGLLLVEKDQDRVYRWLLQNPSGPAMSEQISTLLSELRQCRNPLQAAAAVLETVSSRMEAAHATTQE